MKSIPEYENYYKVDNELEKKLFRGECKTISNIMPEIECRDIIFDEIKTFFGREASCEEREFVCRLAKRLLGKPRRIWL